MHSQIDKFDLAARQWIPAPESRNSVSQLAEVFRFHHDKPFPKWCEDGFAHAAWLWLSEIVADRREELAALFRKNCG